MDIGAFLDNDVSLIYCTRLITKSFLLTGYPQMVTSDKHTRVTVKNLALTCLSSIFQIYPDALLLNLDRNQVEMTKSTPIQPISDILLFRSHSDPQLRGVVRVLIGTYLKATLMKSERNYSKWMGIQMRRVPKEIADFDALVNIIYTVGQEYFFKFVCYILINYLAIISTCYTVEVTKHLIN